MTNTICILSIALVGFTISACNDDNEIENSYRYLDASIKPYQFKEGSYWVFENDTTGVLDSIIVTSTKTDFVWSPPPVQGNPGTKVEYFLINLKSTATSETYNDYLTDYYIRRNGGGDYGELGQIIFAANAEIGVGWSGMEIIDKLPSMTVNGNTFNNIDKVKITANQTQQFDYDTYLYYTNTVGLIKKETVLAIGNIESWSLKRWNVVK